MSLEIYTWAELPASNQEHVANLVSAYTQGELCEAPQMLPVTTEEVFAKFASAVAFTAKNTFCGYVAAAEPLESGTFSMSEIGSLWVPSTYRGQGIAHKLVGHISQSVFEKGVKPYAFCNPLSLGVFLGNGYNEVEPTEVPTEAFSLCAKCPMKPQSGCCDTVVAYGKDSEL